MRKLSLIAGATVALAAVPAGAHHSFAMFDQAKTVTLTGSPVSIQWLSVSNPRVVTTSVSPSHVPIDSPL